MFTVNFSTDNAAFGQSDDEYVNNIEKRAELMRILDEIKDEIFYDKTQGSVIDINGNKVGEWKLD